MPGQPNQSSTPNGTQVSATSLNTAFPPSMGPASGRTAAGVSHQQGSEGGDGNNLFANGGRDLAAYCQRMEEQVKQLSEQVRAMEAEKKSYRDQAARQQEQIDQLSKKLYSLQGDIGSQSQPERPSVSGAS